MRYVGVAVGCFALLSACANLKSVADFAGSGADATTAGDVFAGYVDADAYAVKYAYPPTNHPTAKQISDKEQAQTDYEKSQDRAAGDQAGLNALTLYLRVLGQLASDKLIDVRDSANSISKSLNSLKLTSADSVGPAGSLINLLISAPLDAWRNREVVNLINNANDSVSRLCEDLRTDAQAVATAWGSDAESVRTYFGGISGPPNDIRGAATASSIGDTRAEVFEANQKKATALANALDKVCKGQKTMHDNVGKLDASAVEAVLAGYQSDIESAGKLIHK